MTNPKKSLNHWKEIYAQCEFNAEINIENITLENLIELGISNHKNIVEEISKKADK